MTVLVDNLRRQDHIQYNFFKAQERLIFLHSKKIEVLEFCALYPDIIDTDNNVVKLNERISEEQRNLKRLEKRLKNLKLWA